MNNSNHPLKDVSNIPEFFIYLDVIMHEDVFEEFFVKIILNSLTETKSLDDLKRKFSFKLTGYSQRLIFLNEKKIPELDKSFIQYSPDALLIIDDLPFCPIEFEIYLNREKQLDQLLNYYDMVHLLALRIAKSKKKNIRYTQMATVISFNLSISPRMKQTFVFHNGEYRPLVIFSAEENWELLPTECLTYQAFDLIHSDLSPDDKIKAMDEFVKNRSRYETFYYLNLLLIFGDVTLKTKIETDMKLKEIADDLPGAVESLPPKIAPYLKPDVIKSLTPEQLKEIPAEILIKALEGRVPKSLIDKLLEELNSR
ncbi:MAG: hypothetical protein ACTSRA_21785 [Promethearchaeota archaeon]